MTSVPALERDQIAPAQLAVDTWIEERKFPKTPSIWNWTRSAKMSLGLNGAFWPMILSLFHSSRWVVFHTASMIDSHLVDEARRMRRNSTEDDYLELIAGVETHFPGHMNRIRCASRVREWQPNDLHNPLHQEVARPREAAWEVDTDQANDLPRQLVRHSTLLEAAGCVAGE